MSQLDTIDGIEATKTSSPTATLGINLAERVAVISKGGLHNPSIDEFEKGVCEGRRIYGDLIASLFYTLPQSEYSDAIFMAMSPMDYNKRSLSANLFELSAKLESDSIEKQEQVLVVFKKIIQILTFARGGKSSYEGKEYSIGSFKAPDGYRNVNQSVFYLLNLIKQKNPKYLS